jgi:hypothetical protein
MLRHVVPPVCQLRWALLRFAASRMAALPVAVNLAFQRSRRLSAARTADNITRANDTAFHMRCKAFPRVGLTSTFHGRHFISLTYPAHDLECITFGASADFVDHATFNMTRAAVLVVSYAVEHSQTL